MVDVNIVFDCGITFVVIDLDTASMNKTTCEAESTCATNNRHLSHWKHDLVPPRHTQSAAIEFSFQECQGKTHHNLQIQTWPLGCREVKALSFSYPFGLDIRSNRQSVLDHHHGPEWKRRVCHDLWRVDYEERGFLVGDLFVKVEANVCELLTRT